MGSTWSSSKFFSPTPSTTQWEVKDVLALCEDGDLLLAREQLVDSALRLGVEFVVAQDIRRMQSGQFPSTRMTTLPAWTSCELLLRHQGALNVVLVNVSGVQLVPFEERVAVKQLQCHDRFAVRRLQHDVRTEVLSAALREFASEIATVSPISWHTKLFPSGNRGITPRSPRSASVDKEIAAAAMEKLPPDIRLVLRRMIEIFSQGLKLGDSHESISTPREQLNGGADQQGDDAVAAEWRDVLETLGAAELTARLSAAFTTAVYERVQLLEPMIRSAPMTPSAFWSSGSDSERLVLTPPTALGVEVALARPASS